MKKTYETPALNVETFDVEDVITASSPDSGKLSQVSDSFENPIDFGNLISAPGQD